MIWRALFISPYPHFLFAAVQIAQGPSPRSIAAGGGDGGGGDGAAPAAAALAATPRLMRSAMAVRRRTASGAAAPVHHSYITGPRLCFEQGQAHQCVQRWVVSLPLCR